MLVTLIEQNDKSSDVADLSFPLFFAYPSGCRARVPQNWLQSERANGLDELDWLSKRFNRLVNQARQLFLVG